MISTTKSIQLFAVAVAMSVFCAAPSMVSVAYAQSVAPTVTPVAPDTIKALQEALKKQGIAVKVDGVLDEDTRTAIGKFQTQHHISVTGEPDQATLDKLGIRAGAAATQAPVLAQAAPASPPAGPSATPPASPGQPGPGGMTMDCSNMQGQMQMMMQMMQGMMRMMQTQMPAGQRDQMQPGPMMPGAR